MEASEAQLKHLELSEIVLSGANPRKDIKGERFSELKASIKEHGILEPLIVRPKDKDKWTASKKTYELVAGERRFTAAKELKLETVPVMLQDLDDRTARVIMLLENLQREDLRPLEEATALEELLKDGSITQVDLGKKLGKSQPWIANRVRLLKAPEKLKERLISGQMTPQHLITLLPYCDKEALMGAVLKKMDDRAGYRGGCSVEELQGIVTNELLYDDSGRYAFRPDKGDMGWNMQHLAKDMDLEACRTCKKTTVIDDDDGSDKKVKIRVCLEAECFRPKVAEARKKIKERDAAAMEKVAKGSGVTLKELRYGTDYVRLDGYDFPVEWCKDCPKREKVSGKGSQYSVMGSKSDVVCVRPSCSRIRTEIYREEKPKLLKRISAALETAQKAYLKERAPGLKQHELQYIINALVQDGRGSKKVGGLKEKQLEDLLLVEAIEDEAQDLRYGDIDSKALDFLKRLPFKVEGDFSIMAPPLPEPDPPAAEEKAEPKPKVKEHRKKKGASA